MGLFKSIGNAVSGAVKGATKVISIKNAIGVATGQKSIGSIVTEAGQRTLTGVAEGLGVLNQGSTASTSTASAAQSTPLPRVGFVPKTVSNSIELPAQSAVLPVVASETKKGILGTTMSTGSETADQIISGALGGVASELLGKNTTVKDITNKAIDQTATNWLKDNWYIVAGAVVGLLLLFRGRR